MKVATAIFCFTLCSIVILVSGETTLSLENIKEVFNFWWTIQSESWFGLYESSTMDTIFKRYPPFLLY